jgi:hypothetical protein
MLNYDHAIKKMSEFEVLEPEAKGTAYDLFYAPWRTAAWRNHNACIRRETS